MEAMAAEVVVEVRLCWVGLWIVLEEGGGRCSEWRRGELCWWRGLEVEGRGSPHLASGQPGEPGEGISPLLSEACFRFLFLGSFGEFLTSDSSGV